MQFGGENEVIGGYVINQRYSLQMLNELNVSTINQRASTTSAAWKWLAHTVFILKWFMQ